MPQAATVDLGTFPTASYLREAATQVATALGDKDLATWGLISAPMGKRSNTRKVVAALCGEDEEGKPTLTGLETILGKIAASDDDWEDARCRHRDLKDELERLLAAARG